ncbi:MAG: arsenate reductase family protein [Alphaproteobacteria bacterium]|nr:arsenate reductase family protein [Alphaproteobacteria bacterium]
MSEHFSVVIHHNPECGTSRNVVAFVEACGYAPVIVPYLETGWTRPQLRALFAVAGARPRDMLREKHDLYEMLHLHDADDAALIDEMIAHPVLVNRPIVATPKGVRLCRPSEAVFALLDRRPDGAIFKEDGEAVIVPPLEA